MAHQRPFSFERSQDRRTDAWRLLHGTPSIPALYAAKPGLQLIDEVGIHVIREKSQRQTQRLLDLADREGYPCTTPRDPARRGGTVAINVENAYEISQSLKALDIPATTAPGPAFASLLISITSTRSSTPPWKRSVRSDRAEPGGRSRPGIPPSRDPRD